MREYRQGCLRVYLFDAADLAAEAEVDAEVDAEVEAWSLSLEL